MNRNNSTISCLQAQFKELRASHNATKMNYVISKTEELENIFL